MKKILLLSTSAIFLLGNAIAQNALPNPGFESWVNQGSYEDPSGGWGTIADISGGFIVTCYKASSPDIHSGTYAVKLKSTWVGFPQNALAPGITVTGTLNQTTNGVDGGVVYTLRPDSIVGWHKYAPVAADTGSVEITLSHWNGTSREVVAQAQFMQTATVSSYTRFSKALTYQLSINPDTMVIVLMSSSPNAGQSNSNSTMFIDDLDLIFNPSTGINEQHSHSSIAVYPNPTSSAITFSTELSMFTLKVFDAAGKQIVKKESNASDHHMDVANLSGGIYFYELTTANKTERGKFAVQK